MIRAFISVAVGLVVLVIMDLATDVIVGVALYDDPLSHRDAQTYINFSLVLLPLCSMAGGFVAALIGRQRELGVTYSLAIVGTVAATALFLWNRDTRLPLWFDLVQVAETAVGILIGGYLRFRMADKQVGQVLIGG